MTSTAQQRRTGERKIGGVKLASEGERSTEDRIDALRKILIEGTPEARYAALVEAGEAGEAATSLAEVIGDLLLSRGRAIDPDPMRGPHSIANTASTILIRTGGMPTIRALRHALTDQTPIPVSEACYDQGIYIGDYSTKTLSPQKLALEHVGRLGTGAIELLPDLVRCALDGDPAVGQRALQIITELSPYVSPTAPIEAARLYEAIEAAAKKRAVIDKVFEYCWTWREILGNRGPGKTIA